MTLWIGNGAVLKSSSQWHIKSIYYSIDEDQIAQNVQCEF